MTDYNITALTAPDWLDTGDNAWQLTAASFVAFQSIPGLMVLYAGIMPSRWSINSAFMAFYAFAATLVVWVLYAYKMGFGPQWIPIMGVPDFAVSMDKELIQAVLPAAGITADFPQSTMVYFQFVFAAITVVLIAGSLLGRMNFLAWMIFVPLWITFSYTVGAFSIWAGGFLFQLGVLDYSGGYVIHLSSGTAGFVAAAIVGPRLERDRLDKRPSNTIFVLVGAGLLWIGWNGFNGGDPYAATPDAGAAVLNTNLCTAVSLLTWTLLDVAVYKKPSIIGAVQGMITGLVGITPAAGFVAGWGAIIIGVCTGSIPWVSMNVLGKTRLFHYVDDTLGVVHTHMVTGFLGGFLTGIFATAEGVAAFATAAPGGAVAGNGRQVWVQIVGGLFIIGWNIAVTAIILFVIKYIFRIPLRMSTADLLIGDDAIHGEGAYVFEDGTLLLRQDGSPQEDSDSDPKIANKEGITHDIQPVRETNAV